MVAEKIENHASFLERLRLKVTDQELILIDWAYVNAKYGHQRQKRDSGERYFEHLRAVALILIDELEIYDSEMIQTALMHDMLEDSYLLDEARIEFLFGPHVLKMVSDLSMPPLDQFKSKKERLDLYHPQIRNSGIKTMIVKLCDRLHNLRTLGSCIAEKQQRKSLETVEHYVPLIELIKIGGYPEVAKVFAREFAKELTNLRT